MLNVILDGLDGQRHLFDIHVHDILFLQNHYKNVGDYHRVVFDKILVFIRVIGLVGLEEVVDVLEDLHHVLF